MILKKIILENIRSYEKQEINFTEGSTLLAGDIGSGKTSVLLGIEFALFGLQPGQRGASLLRNQAQEGKVIMEFDIEGHEVIVERALKKGKTISQSYCSIIVDGDKSELSVLELKNKILELLNYPKEFSKKQNLLYKFTVYTPQEEMKQIILQDPDSRINTLRHVFGIDKYKRILENLSTLTLKLREEKRFKEALTENLEEEKEKLLSKENEIKLKYSVLALAEQELSLKQKQRVKVQQEKDEISKKSDEKKRFQQEIEKTKIMISTKKDVLSDNQQLIKQLKEQIKEIEKLRYDESKTHHLTIEISVLKRKREEIDTKRLDVSSKIASLEYKNEENKKTIQKLSDLESCPTCLQVVDAVYRANVLNKLHSDTFHNNQEIEKFKQEKNNLLKELKDTDSKISLIEKQIQELNILKIRYQEAKEKQKRLSELENTNLLLEKDVRILSEQIEILKKSVLDLGKLDAIFEEIQKTLEEALKQERLADIKVAELKKEIDVFVMQINESKEKIKKTEEIKKQLDYLNALEDWLSKKFSVIISHVEKNVMTRLKTEFSKLFEEWFCMLVSDTFNTRLDDDFTPIIENQDYEIDYAYLSGGERTAVALAYRLALNQVINFLLSKIKTRDLVILDEPTDGFSDQQLDKIRDVLQELNVKQLIIVSHEQKIESFVENVLRFKKENGVSRMME